VASTSAFGIVNLIRMMDGDSTPKLHQHVASKIAADTEWEDPSLLVENMVGAFAQRCDRLLDDMECAQRAPLLFQPMWPISVLAAGTRNEEWMMFWSTMRRAVD
jgi:hypothetical protein